MTAPVLEGDLVKVYVMEMDRRLSLDGEFVLVEGKRGNYHAKFTDASGKTIAVQAGRVVGIKPRRDELAAARAAVAKIGARQAAGGRD